MSDNSPPPLHQVGDVVNGHQLTETPDGLQWVALETQPLADTAERTAVPKKRGLPTWGWVAIGGGAAVVALATIIGVTVSGAASQIASPPTASASRAAVQDSRTSTPSAPSRAAAQELVLGETVFGIDTDSGYGWYVVAVENPNADYVFSQAQFTVEAFDASGVLLDSSSEYTTLLSGKTMLAGNFLDVGSAQIDHVEVRGPVASGATYSASGDTGSMTASVSGSSTEYGYTDVTGTVVSSFSEDQEYVKVYVISRDAAGTITGGESTYIDRLPAGGTAQFTANLGQGEDGHTFEAYAIL